MRKGTKLVRLQALCEEGEAIPVNFESELRPLRAAVTTAEAWEAEHQDLLLSLRRLRAHDDETATSEGVSGLTAAGTADDAGASGVQVVHLGALRAAASSAAQLSADFDSSR